MQYINHYKSPIGGITLGSDGENIIGLWFDGEKYFGDTLYEQTEEKELPVFDLTKQWLDIYFSGKNPNFIPKYKIKNLTPFRQEVTNIMNSIEYGKVVTYNDISKIIAKKRNLKRMSSQAVGGAVGWNPICIIIPCHRVVGTNGSLTGYGGGMKNKVELLKLEGNDMNKYFIPKKGTAL